ncbi:uncharacterized protein E0L32_005466 [Thyridium curvatum]|uniref:DNA (cytosine-5-)-methyltransferase n=1 Tax=Thyridium curvatum TaxID=1093900 RepID=A0A507AX27_9PEZI|nr:uncharacterized protein E0L32_005466 [Thyridium curvatum]TPX14502.1 hypothetical protein E0L32_005466 [Thyridium curvatum]
MDNRIVEGIDDDAPAAVEEIIQRREEMRRVRKRSAAEVITIPDDDSDEIIAVEQELEHGKDILIDLTSDDEEPLQGRRTDSGPARNRPIAPRQILSDYNHKGLLLKEGIMIELPERIGQYKIQFLRIQAIFCDEITGRVYIRGFGYTRTKHLRGLLIKKLNEVCRVDEIDEDDPRPAEDQALLEIEVTPDSILMQRHLTITNAEFPAFRSPRISKVPDEDIEEQDVLVCRWTFTLSYRNSRLRKLGKAHGYSLAHLLESDLTKLKKQRFRCSDSMRFDAWREGSLDPTKTPVQWSQYQGEHYTAVDAFSGAGGCSCGQARAGFKVITAIDHWQHACRSYQSNFPAVPMRHMDIADFIYDDDLIVRADVLHLSPPCQFWSPAHTVEGRNDEANIFALFSCQQMIDKIRPRLFTLEQTFGILHGRFENYFNALVQGFTSQGYSVRWTVVPLASWGLPQTRKRLIMIGACPGEKLPPFPKPTHGDREGLKPFVTVRQALAKINRAVDLHNPRAMTRLRRPSWDGDRPLHRTITCSGGQNYHYKGHRDFTLREYACLQGFPTAYKFAEPCVKKQIGNAFPPVCVKVLYDHLRQWLEKNDGKAPRVPAMIPGLEDLPAPALGRPAVQDIILIDDVEMVDIGASPVVCISDSSDSDSETIGRSMFESKSRKRRASPRRMLMAALERPFERARPRPVAIDLT